jgi:riboflavin synthase
VFTGIINAIGQIAAIELQEGQGTYRLATGKLAMDGVRPGDSIAVNGTCLTATQLFADGFSADLSRETLDCTTLGEKKVGDSVNLEAALCVGEALGGHLVTGHVDGIGEVRQIAPDAGSLRLSVEVPQQLARYIAQKGSVCVDGTSLTVNSVTDAVFEVMIVPHTQVETIIATYTVGARVNIEVDMIARYLERIVQYTGPQAGR